MNQPMTDDIVARLREEYFTCECFGLGSGDCSRCESDKQAADEIERLRAAGDRLWKAMSRHDLASECHQCQDMIQAWKETRRG